MRILQSLHEIKTTEGLHPPVGITIGNFDGLHLGHRQLLEKIKAECSAHNLKFVVVTFIPHPHKILYPEKDRFLINNYDQRRELLGSLGVDYVVEINFTRDFSTLKADEFLQKYLLTYPELRSLYLGYDFAFGANKEGTHELVKEICRPKGIHVEIQPKFECDGEVVSSSYIRELLRTGQMEKVARILKRPFYLEGVVVKGEGRGKKIGFPTANVQVSSDVIVPQKGVYVTRTIYKGMTYQSVTNIGNNPTFKDTNQIHIETNLFDFNDDIYGENLQIQFLSKLRDERKFPTVNDLIEQIRQDVHSAKKHPGHQ